MPNKHHTVSVEVQLLVPLIPAGLAWAAARWYPSHSRLLKQAREDLELAERLGNASIARDLRARAVKATELGLKRRDSNDLGRTIAQLGIIGLGGVIGLPVWVHAYPASAAGLRLPVLIGLWFIYAIFAASSLIGGFAWLLKRPGE